MTLSGLIPFWDNYLTDEDKTDAVLSVNKPERAGSVFVCDKPWEGDCDFFSVVNDSKIYRMYYLICHSGFMVGYAESSDGINWIKPELNIYEYNNSDKNNIILGPDSKRLSMPLHSFYGMYDNNPDCPADAKYKALVNYSGSGEKPYSLRILASADGIHFREYKMIDQRSKYAFDSRNSICWNAHTKKYYCYFRTTHTKQIGSEPISPEFNESFVRATSIIESTDLEHWSEQVDIDYKGAEDYQIYTDCSFPYLYDDRYHIAFPTRYNERTEWTDNFDQLCGKELRLKRSANIIEDGKPTMRYGLAITDCLFMFSRDNYRFSRFDEACITPGPEQLYKWVYGDCYPAAGLIETAPRFELEEKELSLLCEMYHWNDRPTELMRYVYRRDGFASYKADYASKIFQTKIFTFNSTGMSINFRTSSRGGIYVEILDENGNPIEGYRSCELFGDTVNRRVHFDKPLSLLTECKIALRFKMRDAELFSMTFTDTI